ncbi:sensor histidine kinase [Aneurinibacillus uraniidurans]|uniref:sensor histidine kinase n=1 Tax=Aneurinibacillus uraniidurans TaxID=2966586 RepID=UPI0023490BA6|nr:GAF domain-containing sensor histidine kinase [Aneurinibacillus sp. B1]WCN37505.1 GAF domain-containing sensor histidine kinase [Aneurinibacillus sp. B1]
MKKRILLLCLSSFLVPALLSIIFAVSANLLHRSEVERLWQGSLLILIVAGGIFLLCLLFLRRFFTWMTNITAYNQPRSDIDSKQIPQLIRLSLDSMMREYVLFSMIAFLMSAFFLSNALFDTTNKVWFLSIIFAGVMMTTYSPFYFLLLVQVHQYLYRHGLTVQMETRFWGVSAAISIVLALAGIFVTTTMFVYLIAKTIGSVITLYDVLERAGVVIVVIGLPLIMLMWMIRRVYLQQLNHRQRQIQAMYRLTEQLHSSLHVNSDVLQDIVTNVRDIVGAKEAVLCVYSYNSKAKLRIVAAGSDRLADWLNNNESHEDDHLLSIPITAGSVSIGWFYVRDKREALQFTEDDLDVLRNFTRSLSVALQNVQYIEELKKERKVAEEAAALKTQILSTMSHELRTPLNAIIGYSDVLLDVCNGTIPERQLTNIQRIKDSGIHLLGLITDILDLSKMEAGEMNVSVQLVNVRALVQFCMQNASVLRGQKSIAFSIEGDKDVWLHTDEQKLKQIVMNLLSNAVKFTEQGSVILRIMKEDNHIVLMVEDTGIGIAPENVGLIFQPFKQIDGSLGRKYKGTGLGLSIVERLVRLLEGSIQVESKQGEGTCFTVQLPSKHEGLIADEKRGGDAAI